MYKNMTEAEAIKRFCYICNGSEQGCQELCIDEECMLFPFRTGDGKPVKALKKKAKKKAKKKDGRSRELTPEERAMRAENLAKARAKRQEKAAIRASQAVIPD